MKYNTQLMDISLHEAACESGLSPLQTESGWIQVRGQQN